MTQKTPETNRYWVLSSRPSGDAFDRALDLEEGPIPSPDDGELRVRNLYLSMDAGTRMWMTPRMDSYQPPTPVGAKVEGMVIGVVEKSRHAGYRAGDLVRAYGQWADYSIARPLASYVAVVDRDESDLRDYLGLLGPNGWTAYLGALEYGACRAGDTFVVSAAAGATGSAAGQIAKIAGCRVIGIAGSKEKCDWVTGKLGFDEALNYKETDVADALRDLCPDGVDVYFDNVAGPILDAVLSNMALFGRVALSGLITSYGAEEPVPGPYKFDMILMRRLTITGFFSPDFYRREPEINPRMRAWRDEGRLLYRFDEVEGVENTVAAYSKLFNGGNTGKVVVRVGDL